MYIYIYVNPRAISTKNSRHFRFSQGRDGIIGRWVMTTKYLATLPGYCKHQPRTLERSSDGCVSASFLLCGPERHGSAMRGLGPSDLGQVIYIWHMHMYIRICMRT